MVESTVDETLNRIRAERDGCDCPPWVERCAHFAGRALRLRDEDIVGEFLPFYHSCDARWTVYDCTETLCGFRGCDVPHWFPEPYFASNDYDDALAAFAQAEEELLRGDA